MSEAEIEHVCCKDVEKCHKVKVECQESCEKSEEETKKGEE